jgi:hypothetical protein
MKIKHSKYRNTGLIFELLVKQIAADTLSKRDSSAVKILKKYYSGNSFLAKEYKLYEFITKNTEIKQNKAESIVSTILEVSRKLDRASLKNQKYELIKDLKESYNLDDFFSIKVRDYKALAALYCLMEAHNCDSLVDPDILVENKVTVMEHLTSKNISEEDAKDALVEEFSKFDKDLRLLTYRVLLEKFNNKYADLLPEQKRILREFITSVSSQTKLRKFINEELENIRTVVENRKELVTDDIIRIKLEEISKLIKPLDSKDKITDGTLVALMQYYDLINELKSL